VTLPHALSPNKAVLVEVRIPWKARLRLLLGGRLRLAVRLVRGRLIVDEVKLR
jgi:hypothetical protein